MKGPNQQLNPATSEELQKSVIDYWPCALKERKN